MCKIRLVTCCIQRLLDGEEYIIDEERMLTPAQVIHYYRDRWTGQSSSQIVKKIPNVFVRDEHFIELNIQKFHKNSSTCFIFYGI
jgi:hypothetical protein